MTDSRRYEHDCEDCRYMGQYLEYDAYYCPREKCLIARHGAEGECISRPASLNIGYSGVMEVVRIMAKTMLEKENE